MTDAEQRLWYHLRNKRLNGIKFRRQQSIGSYIVDFVSMEHKLVVELDGGQHMEQQTAHDAKRTQFLNTEGYLACCAFGIMKRCNRQKLFWKELLRPVALPLPSPPPPAWEGQLL